MKADFSRKIASPSKGDVDDLALDFERGPSKTDLEVRGREPTKVGFRFPNSHHD